MSNPVVTENNMTPDVKEVPGAQPESAESRARVMPNVRGWIDTIGPLLGLLFVAGLFALLRPGTFATLDNSQIILLQAAPIAMAALGMTMIIVSGGIDLSVGSNVALCCVCVALFLNKGVSPLVATVGGVAVGALCGLTIGGFITGLRLSPFIVTLGMWGAVRGVAIGLAHGQPVNVNAPDSWINKLLDQLSPEKRWMLAPSGVWLMLVMAVLVSLMLRYTRFGRHIFAIGSNEQTARLCGVAVDRTKLGIYMLAGALAGLAGPLLIQRSE